MHLQRLQQDEVSLLAAVARLLLQVERHQLQVKLALDVGVLGLLERGDSRGQVPLVGAQVAGAERLLCSEDVRSAEQWSQGLAVGVIVAVVAVVVAAAAVAIASAAAAAGLDCAAAGAAGAAASSRLAAVERDDLVEVERVARDGAGQAAEALHASRPAVVGRVARVKAEGSTPSLLCVALQQPPSPRGACARSGRHP